MVREIQWSELPQQLMGYGPNTVLKLSEEECIIVYNQRTSQNAKTEFQNYQTLHEAGFLVPKSIELVTIVMEDNNIENVQGLIRELIHGKPSKDREKISEYIDRLHEAGFTFRKGVSRDFIESQNGLFLINCSYMLRADNCWHFETACKRYKDKVEQDLQLIEYFDTSSDPEDSMENACLETVLGAFGIP